jgi:hypothetical protein
MDRYNCGYLGAEMELYTQEGGKFYKEPCPVAIKQEAACPRAVAIIEEGM